MYNKLPKIERQKQATRTNLMLGAEGDIGGVALE